MTDLSPVDAMTKPLSPAAQAVLDAAAEVYWDWSDLSPASSSTIAAAALRAATQFNPGQFVPELFGEGWKAAMDELEYIAAELEGAQ